MGGAGFLGTWTAMMAAMMLPSTAPLLRLDHVAASRGISVTLAAAALVWAL